MKTIINLSLICLLLLIVFPGSLFSQTDTVYAEVQGDTVIIKHDRVFQNCGFNACMEVHQDDFLITVTEIDTIGLLADCMCYFDLSVKVGPLTSGEFTVHVYTVDPETGDTIFSGSTSFTIESSGATGIFKTISQHQSDCYSITDVRESPESVPKSFTLLELFPNPFNPTTNINFFIPASGYVELNVYNLLGQKVANLINKNLYEGSHSISWDGSNQPSWIYLVRLKYGDVVKTQKAVLLK